MNKQDITKPEKAPETPQTASVANFWKTPATPEDILRNAMSRVAAIRARGTTPTVVVLTVEDGHLPMLSYSSAKPVDLVACAACLQIDAHHSFSDCYEDD